MLRALAASALPDAQTDRDLYLTLRFAVMDFLVFVEDALGALASSSSDGATVDSMAVVDEKPDAAAAAAAAATTPGGRPYASLADSTSARAAWAKTLKILINSRMASLKAVDSVQSWSRASPPSCILAPHPTTYGTS